MSPPTKVQWFCVGMCVASLAVGYAAAGTMQGVLEAVFVMVGFVVVSFIFSSLAFVFGLKAVLAGGKGGYAGVLLGLGWPVACAVYHVASGAWREVLLFVVAPTVVTVVTAGLRVLRKPPAVSYHWHNRPRVDAKPEQ